MCARVESEIVSALLVCLMNALIFERLGDGGQLRDVQKLCRPLFNRININALVAMLFKYAGICM